MRHTEKRPRFRIDEGDQGHHEDSDHDGEGVQAPVTPYLPMPGYGKDSDMVGLFEKQKAARNRAVACMTSEVFSPPRIVPRATRQGMEKGFSIDLDATDPFTGR